MIMMIVVAAAVVVVVVASGDVLLYKGSCTFGKFDKFIYFTTRRS